MRITKQSSGERGVKGRGEYELCDVADNADIRPNDLVGYTISLRIGNVEIDTRVRVTNAQDKYRLRVDGTEKRNMQATVQVASALLMPPVARGEDKMFGGELVLLHKGYVIKNIVFGNVTVSLSSNRVLAVVQTVECSNRTVEILRIPAAYRMGRIEYLWRHSAAFPEPIANLMSQHEALVCTGGPILASARAVIRELQNKVERLNNELGLYYARTTDVVPALLRYLNEDYEDPQLCQLSDELNATGSTKNGYYSQLPLLDMAGNAD